MRGGNEVGFKLRRGEVDSLFQADVEKLGVAFGVGFFRGGVVGDGLRREKEREHRGDRVELEGEIVFLNELANAVKKNCRFTYLVIPACF